MLKRFLELFVCICQDLAPVLFMLCFPLLLVIAAIYYIFTGKDLELTWLLGD